MATTITIDRRFRGPPKSGNGGYVCGAVARHIGDSAEVTLRKPPPLDRPLALIRDGDGVALRDGDDVVATGRPIAVDLDDVRGASLEAARDAAARTPVTPENHPLPSCFVCGSGRAPGDGLRIFAGPLVEDRAEPTFAAPWSPGEDLADADGLVAGEFVWSALDCPTGYACVPMREAAGAGGLHVLGRMAARIDARPRPGEACVITAWSERIEGRKMFAAGALFGETGALLAVARATWFIVDPAAYVGEE